METERTNDYTTYQLRSFCFCRAQRIANERLHRLDELKAVTDQIFSEDGFKLYKELRKEIVGSHAIEVTGEEKIKLLKEDRKEHNRKAAQGIRNMVKG